MSQMTRQYPTLYSLWLEVVAAGERDGATIAQMDMARSALAERADRLKGPGARREKINLQARYDDILTRLLACGWR